MYGINGDMTIFESNNYEITNQGSTSIPFWTYTFKENNFVYSQDEVFEDKDKAKEEVNRKIRRRIATLTYKIEKCNKEIIDLISKVH